MPAMSRCRQLGISGVWLLSMFATALAMLLGMLALWLSFSSSAELDGRYQSSGQVQLSNNGRFYAMTRQGDSILETSGTVDYGFLGNYRLRVEDGQVTGLASEVDDELVFNLLYGRHKGSTIRLTRLDGCLYALETRQFYCPAHHL
jgi:hypothetical protein